jgi:hypothetical protein
MTIEPKITLTFNDLADGNSSAQRPQATLLVTSRSLSNRPDYPCHNKQTEEGQPFRTMIQNSTKENTRRLAGICNPCPRTVLALR